MDVQKRGAGFDWAGVVPDANALWPAVEPGGELRMLRTVLETQLPPFALAVRTAIQSIIDLRQQIMSVALDSAGIGAVAAILFFIAFNYRYCMNAAANIFSMPLEALVGPGTTPEQASQTSDSCPDETA